ncbi:MAG: aldehyde ferredoxin oxidoreductase family protein [Candidatus Tectomicrobia bacterium]|uniref:Aldehyde ferredoxin oxidoreductase family protein n=1 Tax=Tectimicrobiota bacterium TaxID=2528274 RepID=A0A932GRH4_UNCTE|nr:aldehyde ferredoxin oxidoreductase family protein [Candidatus Tectomicrobia bacterium]
MIGKPKILRVDLSRREAADVELDAREIPLFLGGRGLGAKLLWDHLPVGAEPLGDENRVVFAIGPAQGAGMVMTSKSIVSFKSPATGYYSYASGGGALGDHLRRCGYFAILIEGAAAEPTYLWIHNNRVEFRGAGHLWGKMTGEAQEIMARESGFRDQETVVIGPAGEKLVRFAATISGGPNHRSFSRGGSGAVLGTKKLKGFVICGDGVIPAKDPQALMKALAEMIEMASRHPVTMERARYGLGSDVESLSELGMLPTRNWQRGSFEGAQGISAHHQRPKYSVKNSVCGPLCVMPCSHHDVVKEGEYAGTVVEGPEYDTIYSFGSNCGVDRFDAIMAAEKLCDEYGMDTISTGVAISFAMECYERGILKEHDADGLRLYFGNHREMVEMVRRIGERQGLGELLGEGVMRAAAKIGQGSQAFAMHGKGLELGGYECRGAKGQAIQYSVGTRGGCHHDLGLPARTETVGGKGAEMAGKGDLTRRLALSRIVFDSAVLCTFSRSVYSEEVVARALTAITGEKYTAEGLLEIGERVLNLERALQVRDGLTRAGDRLPDRLLKEKLPDGPSAGEVINLEPLKDDFYRAMGWDLETGKPAAGTLRKFGLDQVARTLWPTSV